ncbi:MULTISPECIES: HAD family hydrolase [Acidithiobacillus]|uniref:phosphoglycolate phosphatase n=2 Tax=Acidithiobacillus TaxID=119977 RepID=A0A179BK80_ACIFR|nr:MULTISPECIES: HAD family hydrolase [Acidithiobacillus]MEB8486950.1 HAD family hydrolase [Acidithiobacillus ferriphilus]MEB8489751.1 HAD family hydrolase [Acidithiobacillus ferriphilus]MEB8493682.1 HAD family hydrolase [Acidithiobacillus ferriphilus]MEB8512741.1 HAD family hydrolase [Acidithiobacillus ferriphilus]MEB8520196.1 HAD family hydrolase [Acidithiobacillus ferriphilus]
MHIETVIFDLDGTLIDSAQSLLSAFDGAFKSLGCVPVRPLDRTLIGPPLTQILAALSGSDDADLLAALAIAFKDRYDDDSYRETAVFEGVETMLSELVRRGHRLYIATNKRKKPTYRILEHLGWTGYFDDVYTLDTFEIPAKDKTQLLEWILRLGAIDVQRSVYTGDRDDDGRAALANNLAFLLATWGYGENIAGVWRKVNKPENLPDTIGAM